MQRDEELKKLETLTDRFNMKNHKDKIIGSVDDTLFKLEGMIADATENELVLIRVMDKIKADHEKNTERSKSDVYDMAMELYKRQLKDTGNKDIQTLTKKL